MLDIEFINTLKLHVQCMLVAYVLFSQQKPKLHHFVVHKMLKATDMKSKLSVSYDHE
jgi:hypothetical protein